MEAGNAGGHHHQLFPFQTSNNYAPYSSVSSSKAVKGVEEQQENGEMKLHLSGVHVSQSPWHRMKWTDGMIRLLIMIVYCVGDDGGGSIGTEDEQQQQASKSKKGSTGAAGGGLLLLQKKGKWKSVSRAMMEKGYYVSPQQCEDKFNDLNKRYKRVNELLGKGTACRVVENQGLLDTMDHLSPKAKEEARKLLNSKHLFFREMCAYHSGASSSAQPHHHQECLHRPSSEKGGQDNNSSSSNRRVQCGTDEEEEEEEDDEIDIDFDHDDNRDHEEEEEDEEDDYDEEEEMKRVKGSNLSPLSASTPPSLSLSSAPASTSVLKQQLKCDLASMGGEQQQRQWLKRKAMELEEQRLGYQRRALELERQQFKWLRFSSNKEREMEKMRLRNQRLRLENDRMLLLLHRKEQELTNVAANASNTTSSSALQFAVDSDHHLHPNLKLMH